MESILPFQATYRGSILWSMNTDLMVICSNSKESQSAAPPTQNAAPGTQKQIQQQQMLRLPCKSSRGPAATKRAAAAPRKSNGCTCHAKVALQAPYAICYTCHAETNSAAPNATPAMQKQPRTRGEQASSSSPQRATQMQDHEHQMLCLPCQSDQARAGSPQRVKVLQSLATQKQDQVLHLPRRSCMRGGV